MSVSIAYNNVPLIEPEAELSSFPVPSSRADSYGSLIRYIRQSHTSLTPLSADRERDLRVSVRRYRYLLTELLSWPQLRQSIFIEMQLLQLPATRQGLSADQAIASLLVEHQKQIALGVLETFTGNITTRQARHILFHAGAEHLIPGARRRWLLPHELRSLLDALALHIKRDYPRYKAAQTELFFGNVRLVYDLAFRGAAGSDRFYDAFQEGCMALLNAIDKTCDSSCRLSTCAHDWITGAIKRFHTVQRYPVHVPVNLVAHLPEDREPRRVSLAPALDEETVPGEVDSFVHPAELLTRRQLRPLLLQLFECLTDKQRQVILLRYGLGPDGIAHSLEEAARIIGVSFQEVDRREKRAIERVQHHGSPALLRELALCLA